MEIILESGTDRSTCGCLTAVGNAATEINTPELANQPGDTRGEWRRTSDVGTSRRRESDVDLSTDAETQFS